jgi:hypothetical protein
MDRPPNPGPASAQVRRLVRPRATRICVRRLLGYAEDSGAGRGKAGRMTSRTLVRSTALALLVAAVGIVVQILGGADYPAVPPGIILLLIAAGVVWFGPWRWAPLAGVVAGAFLVVGLFVADQASRLLEVDTVLDTLGLWIQMLAVVAATVLGVLTLVRRGRSGAPA